MGKLCQLRGSATELAIDTSVPISPSDFSSPRPQEGHLQIHEGETEIRSIPRPSVILMELLNQIPNLVHSEAFDLALEVDKQLAGVSRLSTIRFRRTHLVDPSTAAWITILDYICRLLPNLPQTDQCSAVYEDDFKLCKGVVVICQLDTLNEKRPVILHSTIFAFDSPSQPTAIQEWNVLSKELNDLGEESLRTLAIQLTAVHTDSGSEWRDPGIPSHQSTNNFLISGHIARICAWGVVATGTRHTCYRFFAACVQTCFVSPTVLNCAEISESLQNLSLNIIPLIRVQNIEYGNIEEM